MLTTRERSRMEGIRQMGLVVECAVRIVILVVPHSGSWRWVVDIPPCNGLTQINWRAQHKDKIKKIQTVAARRASSYR